MQSKLQIKDNKYFPFKSGVYSLETLEGKVLYIGSVKRFTDALSRHLYYLKRNMYSNTNKKILQDAYNAGNLVFNVIEDFDSIDDEKLSKLEQKYIKLNKDTICNYQLKVKRHSSNGCKLDSFKRRLNAKGVNNPNSKYAEQMVSEILWLKLNTDLTPTQIAKHYNLSTAYTCNIGITMWIYAEPKKPLWYGKNKILASNTVAITFENNNFTVSKKPINFTL